MQTAVAPSPALSTSLHEKLYHLGWENGAFSDVTITALGASYPAHRILLSQSPYFEKLLRGPWLEASTPLVDLKIDDPNIRSDTLTHALQFLYGRPVEVDSSNVFGILAVSSFLELEPLCQRCVDFAVGDLNVDTFNNYYSFSKIYEYGYYTGVIRWACLDFLKLHGFREARSVLKELETKDLIDLLQDDDFWVPTEEMRFQLIVDLISGDKEGSSDGPQEEMSCLLMTLLEELRYEHIEPQNLERLVNTIPEGLGVVRKAVRMGTVLQESLRQGLFGKSVSQPRPTMHLRSISEPGALNPCARGGHEGCLQAIRMGLEFPSVMDVYKRKGLVSKEFFYAGSLWHIRLVERRPNPSAPPYIGVFMHRRQANSARWGFRDKREDICAMLRVRIGWASWKTEKECEGRFNTETWDSYGWPQFMKQNILKHCLELDGSLRVIVTIKVKQ